jgi:broad specificity phosphatase PhoE
MPAILLIRHAQASFGTADYDVLSTPGLGQVSALVEGLGRRGLSADHVVCGSLQRQRDTAQPCADAAGVPLAVDPGWNEYDDRDILGHHAEVPAGLEQRPGDRPLDSRQFQEILNGALRRWIAAGERSPCQESHPQFTARLSSALDALSRRLDSGQTAIAVSSGGAIAALSAGLLGLPPQAMIAFNHVSINTGITKLAVGRSGTTLISSNEHAHLEESADAAITFR